MKLVRRPLALAAVLSATALTAGAAAPVFAAVSTSATSGVSVSDTETIQVYTNADGKVDNQRVYEQLVLTGHGQADVANPVSTDGLRNLDGFGGLHVQDGKQIVDTTVDGEKRYRTVSNFTGQLPLKVSVAYELDGKPVTASQVVGKSGHLKVTYTVENTSGVDTPLTYKDGSGKTVTKTVSVPIPMVATLATTTPDTYRNVTSSDANMGGDGHGGMMLNFTMTLLPPVGPATSTVSYEADITDGAIPRAELTGLPVDPLTNPTFSSAAKQYKSGADQGIQLTDGANQLNGGLVQLHDGASQLLSGILQLHDGAGQLSSGLTKTAVPGADQLADGTTQLADGGKQLKDGLDQLKSKAPQLADGVYQIRDGQKALAKGLTQLYNGVQALPAKVKKQVSADPNYKLLMASLPALLASSSKGHDDLTALLPKLQSDAAALDTLPGLTKDQQAAADELDAAVGAKGPIASATGALGGDAFLLGQLKDQLPGMIDQITAGIHDELLAGIGTPVCPPGASKDPKKMTLRCGSAQLVDGTEQLAAAVPQLTDGVDQLDAGAGQLSTGLGQANDGAHQLASGLGGAADGAGQIDAGLGQAAGGAPKIVDGLKQASDDGAQKIASAGDDTAKSYGEMYAEISAGAQRAHNAMAIGAPAGATGLTAYDYIIQGADGQSGRDVNRGLMAGGVLVVGAGGFLLRRRFFA